MKKWPLYTEDKTLLNLNTLVDVFWCLQRALQAVWEHQIDTNLIQAFHSFVLFHDYVFKTIVERRRKSDVKQILLPLIPFRFYTNWSKPKQHRLCLPFDTKAIVSVTKGSQKGIQTHKIQVKIEILMRPTRDATYRTIYGKVCRTRNTLKI